MPTDAFSLYVWIPWRCCICSTWTDRLRAVRIQSTTPMRKKFRTRTSSGNPVIYYSSDPSLCCRKILFLLTISQQFISSSYFKLIYFPSKLKGEDTCLLLFLRKIYPCHYYVTTMINLLIREFILFKLPIAAMRFIKHARRPSLHHA